MATMRYRLGLDLGAKSLGWAMLRLNPDNEPVAVIRAGVRIFPDGRNPKDGSSLAVTRRQARQMRRRRDRLLRRKERLSQALLDFGFFPADAAQRRELVGLDPYVLRCKGLSEPLTPAEFARALFHINQRRGFKSNRKTDKKDNDSGALKKAIGRVREQMLACKARTVGEWLAIRHAQREGVRARLRGKSAKDKAYDLYIDRAMIEAEFDALWAAQSGFDPATFHETVRAALKDILLYQRPLKPVDPGRCTLLPDEKRAPLALPSVQRFRIYQELNNLRLLGNTMEDIPLSLAQRDTLAGLLEAKGKVTFTAMRKALGLPGSLKFNLEDAKRDHLKGNATAAELGKDRFFGRAWFDFSLAKQDEIVSRLLATESEAELIEWLQSETDVAEDVAESLANTMLVEGYGNLGALAISRILPELGKDVITYAEAVRRAGFDSHSALSHAEQSGEIMPALPYYGEALQRHVAFGTGKLEDSTEKRYGRIANPTVHIGLNELRKVVNGLIGRYGNPDQVVIEVARELKQGKALRDEISREQARRQEENTQYRDRIRPLLGGAEPSAQDVQRMRLWVELNPTNVADRRCPYTGEQISLEMLFSEAVEIEHILPFSQTLDDSLNNKTVALRRANRDKGNRTPFEAFGHSPAGYDYATILERANHMPRDKGKRFAPDGYARWLREDKDFLARALNDTAYLSRIAKEYLSLVCPPGKVWVIPGRLTALLRRRYGLNELLSGSAEKNRDDHRHHALDACVIGITDRSLLQRFSQANAQAREAGLNRLVKDMPLPWPTYHEHVRRALHGITISFRPDHGHQGGLHNDTAYGLRPDGKVVHRVPLESFKGAKDLETTDFANEKYQQWLLEVLGGLEGRDFAAAVERLTHEHGAHRARIVETLAVIPIASRKATARHGVAADGSPRAYKGYKGDSNYCIEIWCNDKGRWEGTVISSYEANRIVRQEGLARLRHPGTALNGKPLVMRLMIDDMVRLKDGDSGATRTLRVATISGNGQIFMAEHREANVDARNRDKNSGFKYISKMAGSLQAAQGRRVTVSPIGEVRDPGPYQAKP
jgi:CRISPR-associated endonuclease Csn1